LDGDPYFHDKPQAFLLGGGTASGKTSVGEGYLEDFKEEYKHMTLIDSDKIKEMLPEFERMKEINPMIAANYVHEESSDIVNKLIGICIDQGRSFMYDSIQKAERFQGRLS
jgi:hypothetical protein